MKPKFKFGDQVIVKGQKGVFKSLNGKKGIVQKTFVIGNRRWYTVKLENITVEASARELDKVDVKVTSGTAVKVGDFVKDKFFIDNFSGLTGRIEKIGRESFGKYCVVRYTDDKVLLRKYKNLVKVLENKNEATNDRTISLTLEQAKEYYKQGGELRKIALQAFTEEELKPKLKYPKTWAEYRKNHASFEVTIPESEVLQKQVLAFTALLLIRKEWIHIWSQEQGLKEDWKPNWLNHEDKYYIMVNCQSLCIGRQISTVSPLSFPTKELATDFLNTFKDLLEQAKGLY